MGSFLYYVLQVMRFSFARDMPWANTDSDYDSDSVDGDSDEENDDENEDEEGPTVATMAGGTSSSQHIKIFTSGSGSSSNSISVTQTPNSPRPYQQFAVPDPEVGEVSFRHMHFSREGQETENGHIHLPSDRGDEWLCIDMNRLRQQVVSLADDQ